MVWKVFRDLLSHIATNLSSLKMLTLPLKMDFMFLVSGISLNRENAAIMVVVTAHIN
jgi:hypothetical protein